MSSFHKRHKIVQIHNNSFLYILVFGTQRTHRLFFVEIGFWSPTDPPTDIFADTCSGSPTDPSLIFFRDTSFLVTQQTHRFIFFADTCLRSPTDPPADIFSRQLYFLGQRTHWLTFLKTLVFLEPNGPTS